MRQCPFTGCGKDIPDAIFACGHHWHRLNPIQKRAIHDAYESYMTDKIDLETLREIQQGVLDAVQVVGFQDRMEKAPCRSCKAPMLWSRNADTGSLCPLDAEPSEDGNIVLLADGTHRVLKKDLFEQPTEGPRYKSHYATCPNAKSHRKKK